MQKVYRNSPGKLNRKLSVAPMLDWTNRFCRYFHRLMSRHALLYTEMITTHALLHGDKKRLLDFDAFEHPLALQSGGSDPEALAVCARMAEDFGYDEVNLNVGCPSDRVSSGRFGACLMAEPERVAECVAAMQDRVCIPVTVKSRIGIDQQDSYQELQYFIRTVADAGCETFIIHARKAWLKGLSPKQNRAIPPLRYDRVHQLKQDFPHLQIVINGGIVSIEQALQQLQQVDGVMIGREAYHNPYILSEVDGPVYQRPGPVLSRIEVVEAFIPYIQRQLQQGVRLNRMVQPILGLFHGQPGARRWRRYLSEQAVRPGADQSCVLQALAFVR